jgi:serine/threonine-protein kinase
VWALGSTLYLLLTDRLPFSDIGDHDSFDIKSFERPMILASRLNIVVDARLDQILHRAMAFRPEDRYPSAGEMLSDLTNWNPRALESLAQPKSAESLEMSKSVLGVYSAADEEEARRMAGEAAALSRTIGKLSDAADLMEEALNKWPDLRPQYEYQLKLWRRGIAM